ncbi:hypothetical protein J5N97_003866 [Dioscorea zingiberensis]|uniref:U1-type domain-containing protein n=1 Tax=Dioscorea zingiberensis TaxID=325984 RepID=A0A9D5D7H8_9LILI|nr:hypothetical protein J5N97_003866 [Dioscorea zingiberensis]
MVWFQCEDCGENLKKPKLPNHFRICSAFKLSCIDCGKVFDQQSVQSHTQCISETEKYGPKDQGKASHVAKSNSNKPNQHPEVDINVGLSSHPPWFCSLCNTNTTSKQTLLLHADGKKHRAKARAFHAAQNQTKQTEDGVSCDTQKVESVEANGSEKLDVLTQKDPAPIATDMMVVEGEKESLSKRKRNNTASNIGKTKIIAETNGTGMQAEHDEEAHYQRKKNKHTEGIAFCENNMEHLDHKEKASNHKIKWKKLVKSTLKMNPDGRMKIKKLQKLVIKALQDSGVIEDKAHLQEMLMDKIKSSSRFKFFEKEVMVVQF